MMISKKQHFVKYPAGYASYSSGDWETFSRGDQYAGHPLSGWAHFGPVSGDHRMISAIAEDIEEAFSRI